MLGGFDSLTFSVTGIKATHDHGPCVYPLQAVVPSALKKVDMRRLVVSSWLHLRPIVPDNHIWYTYEGSDLILTLWFSSDSSRRVVAEKIKLVGGLVQLQAPLPAPATPRYLFFGDLLENRQSPASEEELVSTPTSTSSEYTSTTPDTYVSDVMVFETETSLQGALASAPLVDPSSDRSFAGMDWVGSCRDNLIVGSRGFVTAATKPSWSFKTGGLQSGVSVIVVPFEDLAPGMSVTDDAYETVLRDVADSKALAAALAAEHDCPPARRKLDVDADGTAGCIQDGPACERIGTAAGAGAGADACAKRGALAKCRESPVFVSPDGQVLPTSISHHNGDPDEYLVAVHVEFRNQHVCDQYSLNGYPSKVPHAWSSYAFVRNPALYRMALRWRAAQGIRGWKTATRSPGATRATPRKMRNAPTKTKKTSAMAAASPKVSRQSDGLRTVDDPTFKFKSVRMQKRRRTATGVIEDPFAQTHKHHNKKINRRKSV